MMTEIHAKPKGGGSSEAGPATSPGGTKHVLMEDSTGPAGVAVKKLNVGGDGKGQVKKEALKAQNKKKNLKRL